MVGFASFQILTTAVLAIVITAPLGAIFIAFAGPRLLSRPSPLDTQDEHELPRDTQDAIDLERPPDHH